VPTCAAGGEDLERAGASSAAWSAAFSRDAAVEVWTRVPYSLPSFFSHADGQQAWPDELFYPAPIRSLLAGHNVVNVSDRKAGELHVSLPRILKNLSIQSGANTKSRSNGPFLS